MNILIMKLCLVFAVIIAILWMKRPLFWAISGGLAAALILYGVHVSDALSIMGSIFVDHLKPREIMPMFRTAFEPVIIFNTILIMMFKDIITYTGVIHELPVFFGGLSIPLPMVFALIFFFGTIISGSNAIIPLCMPMAMAAMPEAGVPLLVLLMGSAYAAMQVSPTHVCLFIAAECFKVDIGALVRRNIPMILVFFAVTLAYTALLGVF